MADNIPGLAEGLAAQDIPLSGAVPGEGAMPEEEPEAVLAFNDAATDVFEAMKSDDFETFKAALKDAIIIAMNTG